LSDGTKIFVFALAPVKSVNVCLGGIWGAALESKQGFSSSKEMAIQARYRESSGGEFGLMMSEAIYRDQLAQSGDG